MDTMTFKIQPRHAAGKNRTKRRQTKTIRMKSKMTSSFPVKKMKKKPSSGKGNYFGRPWNDQ